MANISNTSTFLPVDQAQKDQRQQMFSAHLQNQLLPELEGIRQALGKVEFDISEYEDLQNKLDQLAKLDKNESIESLIELGAGVWVESRIFDTQNITLDLGFDIHMDMTLGEAKEYVEKKMTVLKKKRDNLSQKEEFLVWEVGQFHGALSQEQDKPILQV
ncbi:prefoldin, alpha subunit [Kwoniella dendrophila CBS 6074]|uniref:Prefoldin, alpha subunit n=1 Tax=Kwoniella dendrophila CBS 6074 TaxID=1295534 RepID=A0AAX4JZX8_9TREE